MAVIAKQRYKLDIAPKGGWVIVYASQHDNGAREIEFEIINQGNTYSIPASINISVQGVKSNSGYFSHSCSYSGNIVKMALANDMTDVIGKAICVLKFTNSSQQKLATAKFILNVDSDSSSEGVIIDTEAEEIFNQMLNEIRAQAASISADIAELQSMVGSPLVASTVSAMTDHNKIYVYTGSESGYTNGNWYYWNGSAWTSGGVYNSTAFETDKTLFVENMAADAKAVGDALINRSISTNNAVDGKRIGTSNGGISDNVNFSYVEFVVFEGDAVEYKTQRAETDVGLAFYDDNYGFISGFPAVAGSQMINVPANAKIARASYRTQQISNFYVKICKNIEPLIIHIAENDKAIKKLPSIEKVVGLVSGNSEEFSFNFYLTLNNTRAVSQDFLLTEVVNSILISAPPTGFRTALFFYDSSDVQVANTSWNTGALTYINGNQYAYCRVFVSKSDNSAISISEINTLKSSLTALVNYVLLGKSVGYVSKSGSDSNDGLSRSNALLTISTAINKGFKNIIVEEGIYSEAITINRIDNLHLSIDMSGNAYTTSNADNPKVVIDGENNNSIGITLSDCYNCTFEGVEVKNFNSNAWKIDDCSGIKLVDCVVHDIAINEQSGGGYVITDSNVDFYNCVAYNIGTMIKGTGAYHIDGFNIHNTGTVNLYDCCAYNCMDDGVSHHDACCGTIDGGEWYNCGKGGIASPTHGAKVNVKNVYSHDNEFGIYAGNSYAELSKNVLVSGCVFKDNTSDIYVMNNTLNVWGCLFDTQTAEGGGVVNVIS